MQAPSGKSGKGFCKAETAPLAALTHDSKACLLRRLASSFIKALRKTRNSSCNRKRMFVPLCIQVGNTDNPCRCKIVGPTLGFIGTVIAVVICWPLGALIWCCNKPAGNRLFEFPVMHGEAPDVVQSIPKRREPAIVVYSLSLCAVNAPIANAIPF